MISLQDEIAFILPLYFSCLFSRAMTTARCTIPTFGRVGRITLAIGGLLSNDPRNIELASGKLKKDHDDLET